MSSPSFYLFQGLTHPQQIAKCSFQSDQWKRANTTLYRVILKLHRIHLLPVQQQFGDRFVQAEFHRHVDATEKYARLFYQSWYGYAAQLVSGQTHRDLTEDEKRLLTPEQKDTLRELRSHVVRARHAQGDLML